MIHIGITKRSDTGKWRCFWTTEGKRRVSQDCDTRQQAENLRDVLKQRLNPDLHKGPTLATWDFIVEKYLSHKEDRLADTSLAEVKHSLEIFKTVVTPKGVTIWPEDITKFIKSRKKEVAANTINKDLTNIITFLNWCCKNNFLDRMPYIEKLPAEERDVFVMTDEQCTALLTKAKEINERFYQICKIGLVTGQRINDILTLSITQCDFKNNKIKFTPQKTKRTSKRKHIDVPIKKEYMDEIASWFADGRRWLFFEDDPTGKQTSKLFYGDEMDDFRDMFKKAEIDLPKGTLTHVFRHTASTRLARISVPMAMKITGHKDATLFMKRYVNPHSDDLRKAQDELDLPAMP